MSAAQATIIAIVNLKGGVGKTTTAMNLAGALAHRGSRVLAVDMDPHGNLTQGFGISIEKLHTSVRDLIVDRSVPVSRAVYEISQNLSLIGANPLLADLFRWMIATTNAELRLRQRLHEIRGQYDFIVIDACPGLGVLLNSVLNAANALLIPADTGFYGYMGVQELFNEVKEIRLGTNAGLDVLGFVLTMCDRTLLTKETYQALKNRFGDLVFRSTIRRCVNLRESPALGKHIFDYAPKSNGAEDYARFADEVISRLKTTNVVALNQATGQGLHHD